MSAVTKGPTLLFLGGSQAHNHKRWAYVLNPIEVNAKGMSHVQQQ